MAHLTPSGEKIRERAPYSIQREDSMNFLLVGGWEAGPPGEKRKFMTILVRITPVIKQPGLMQKWEEEGEAFLLVCFYCVMQREEFKRENNPR